MNTISPFHIAIPVIDLQIARDFYAKVLNCPEGRSSDKWVDFDLYGHQLVIHETGKGKEKLDHNPVDGHEVPIPHYGVVLPWKAWEDLSARLKSFDVQFIIEPYIRFQGEAGEQATMFFLDPSGNALEFKAFKDLSQLFAK